jgi:hypothetical protein
MNPLKHGSIRLIMLVVTLGVIGVWVYANVVNLMVYQEAARAAIAMPGASLPPVPEILAIPGWAVTLVGAVLGAKQIEKHFETRNDVVIPPPEK